ncbi:hypothetical protein FB567DRAFT_117956 [Paraphoma chrysanthemicola]|uniref:C2H2-type domain-containing protein n=1 Tax=Paraphoma chrysanthemicola TaxID=798071 RepID=A0A8K0VVW7_9PLEO|nr:hypothetical protein FB567DRAFT_117956 [Paraphoma chrysanthemicola]
MVWYHVAEPGEYLVITGTGIKEPLVKKKAFVYPGQMVTKIAARPSTHDGEIQSRIMADLELHFPVSLTVCPKDDPDAILKYYRLVLDGSNMARVNKILAIVSSVAQDMTSGITMDVLLEELKDFQELLGQALRERLHEHGLLLHRLSFASPPESNDEKTAPVADYSQCKHEECSGLKFTRRCEWKKHMDKHDRPYKCDFIGCERLQGFTYSGGLLRHQREVHGLHGGTRKPLVCPFHDCKRSLGFGFMQRENLAEHILLVHLLAKTRGGVGPYAFFDRPHDSWNEQQGSSAPGVDIPMSQLTWADLIGTLASLPDLGKDSLHMAQPAQEGIFSKLTDFGLSCLDPTHVSVMLRRLAYVFRKIDHKSFATIATLSLLPAAQAAPSHISATGIPASNTVAGALAWAIAAFGDGQTIGTATYWVAYAVWTLAAFLAVGFTASSIAEKHRASYLGLFSLVECIILASLVASSVDDVEKMVGRLKAWMPMATILVAGALPMAFKRVSDTPARQE